MSVFALHRERSPEQIEQLIVWYEIRDLILYAEDWKVVVDRAACCDHPDAVWLTKLFAGRDVRTRAEARKVFLACENDARAICFSSSLFWNARDVRRAADLGYAYAQSSVAAATSFEVRFQWAERSAAQGERDAFFWLGICFRDGEGCVRDIEKAKESFLVAAELGDVHGMLRLGELFDRNDAQRFVWLGKAALSGDFMAFLEEFGDQIQNFNSGSAVFVIGRVLRGRIDNKKRTIFGKNDSEIYPRVGLANQAVHFYEFQLQSYRKAVDSWTIVGLRNRVVKDIRKMIGKMIWDAREEARYELNCKNDCVCPFCISVVDQSSSDQSGVDAVLVLME
jgi:hypothetical protein